MDVDPLNNDATLADARGIASADGFPLADLAAARNLFDAMVDGEEGESPGFLTTKQHPEQTRFACCQALFKYPAAAKTPSALVTIARTDRQKRNRAFTAELLAPEDWIRKRISGTWVGPDEVDEWSDEFGVSTAVVAHQIMDHRLAQMADY